MIRQTYAILLLALALIALTTVHADAASNRADRMHDIATAVQVQLTALLDRAFKPDATISERDLPNGAFASLVLNGDSASADLLLRRAFASQNMDEASKGFGTLPWSIGNAKINDANAIEFGMQAIGPILIEYGPKLDPALATWLKPHVVAGIAAIRKHGVTIGYTNIYLMKLTNLLLLGQAIGDSQAQTDAEKMFHLWFDFTRENGIREFDSPTYYATDINSLLLGYKFAAKPTTRAMYKAALDLIWTEIAANYFAGRSSFSGPHSRDYDFLNGYGELDPAFYAIGLRPHLSPTSVTLQTTTVLECLSADGYIPGDQIMKLTTVPERLVGSFSAGHNRTNYITPDFTIGSASGDYTAQDKLIDIELASTPTMPAISVVQDTFDAPYGIHPVPDKAGHKKPVHLTYHPICAQSKGLVLVLLDANAAKPIETSTLATDIILPVKANAILLDGKPVTVTEPFVTAASATSMVTIRQGAAAVAIRILAASAVSAAPVVKLEAEKAGLSHGALRLAIYEYVGPPTTIPDAPLPVCLLMAAQHITSDADLSAFEARIAGIPVQQVGSGYRVTDGATTLEVDADGSRKVNGQPLTLPILTVNGVDLATPILSSVPH